VTAAWWRPRVGHWYRVYDLGRFTLVLDPESNGGVYSPRLALIRRTGAGSTDRRLVAVPTLSWRAAYRWRRFGALKLYALEHRIVYGIMRRPNRP
jgi:hypothetical protein